MMSTPEDRKCRVICGVCTGLLYVALLTLGVTGIVTPHWYSSPKIYGGLWKYCEKDTDPETWTCHQIDQTQVTGKAVILILINYF